MVLGLIQLSLDISTVVCNHFVDTLIGQLLAFNSFLLRTEQLMVRDQFDYLTLLDGHRPQDELQANLLIVILDSKDVRLVDILLVVGTISVNSLHIEAKLIHLSIVP